MDKFIGIDVGTTGTKSILADSDMNILSKGYLAYPLITPFTGAFEQDPDDWFLTTVESLKQAIKEDVKDVKGISVSAQGGSFFPADKDGIKLYNALTWLDVRSNAQAEKISLKIEPERFYEITGWRLSPSSMICKLLWLKENQKEIYEKADTFFTTSDYVYYKLTGKKVIDYTSAAMTGLFDIHTCDWNEELLSIVGLSKDRLPTLMPCGTVIGTLIPSIAKQLGLSENVKVICGAHDQYAGAIGSGTVKKNDILISTGTTWVVFGNGDAPCTGESHISPCPHPAGGYGLISSAVSSGTVMEWLKREFNLSYAEIADGVSKTNPDENLIFYPFVSGCGEYRKEKNVCASVLGLTMRHSKYDIIRSAMEGVAFEIKIILSEFEKSGVIADKIIVSGGATSSKEWMEILSTVLEKDILITEEKDICPLGAVVIAEKTISNGSYKHTDNVKKVVCNKDLFEFYRQKFERYLNNDEKNKI